jgi:NNP family nitrate/nitrite transporter-like MFS transporter
MLLWGVTLVSLIWMYWTEIVPKRNDARVETVNFGRAT